ncbi:hypothetical protein V6259_15560 [Marinomonas sp. TI.3.20]|uniref:CAF17-like 4Fe-4S cluster assembly/insertion protein YgfZ n=1 Tax=Marinomonas sp. TI.3.20 TaxID=3121296 RepID=UPI0031203295
MNTFSHLVASLLGQGVSAQNTQLGILRINGSDASKLLQGQASCDMTKLSESTGLYGAICSVKGRIISNFFVIQEQEDTLLIMNKPLVEIALNHLKKYAVFFQVNLSDASEEYAIESHFSTSTSSAIPDALPEQLPVEIGNESITLAISDSPTRATLCLQRKHDAVVEQVNEKMPAPSQTELLSLLTARPLIDVEQSEKVLPQWLNMQRTGGISFTKGCYTGQEIVARMQYRGKSKKQLALFSWEGDHDVSPTLLDSEGKSIGSVFKSARFNNLNIAQIILNIEPTDVDNFFLGEQAITLQPLPYRLENTK